MAIGQSDAVVVRNEEGAEMPIGGSRRDGWLAGRRHVEREIPWRTRSLSAGMELRTACGEESAEEVVRI